MKYLQKNERAIKGLNNRTTRKVIVSAGPTLAESNRLIRNKNMGGRVVRQGTAVISQKLPQNNNEEKFKSSLKNLNSNNIKYKHSGDFGDIIYFLPAMKYRPGSLYIQSSSFTRQRLTPENCKAIIPLLEVQPYVKSVDCYKSNASIDNSIVDADFWRKNYDNTNLAETQLKKLHVPLTILNEPWISVPATKKIASQVINRTTRYHSKFPIDYVGNDAVFIGSLEEHSEFCREFKKIPYYKTEDLLEAAMIIAGADLFIGNQSCCYAICEGLKQNAIVEAYGPAANCCFKRPNVKYCYIEDDWQIVKNFGG